MFIHSSTIYTYYLRLVFTSDRVVIRNVESETEHPFHLYSVTYDPVKTALSESQAEGEE